MVHVFLDSHHVGKILLFGLFHFSLVIHFLNGCLDGFLVPQELVRPNSAQILIQLQENGDSSRKSNVYDVVI